MARKTTFFGTLPVTIKPPIKTLSPVPTLNRVEMFSSASFELGVGDGEALGLGVGDGDADGDGVGVGIGFTMTDSFGSLQAPATASLFASPL